MEKKKLTLQEWNIIFIVLIVFILGYFAGRLVSKLEQIDAQPAIMAIPDINKEVPFVQIKEIKEGKIYGKIGKKNVRIMTVKNIAEIKKDKSFELDISSLAGAIENVFVPYWAQYIASKKGKKFYAVDSPKAERIVPENRVYFKTEEEAIRAGYMP